MTSYKDALAEVMRHARRLPAVSVPLNEAPGAVLARPVIARSRMPRFDQSAVDGYAVRVGDCDGAGTESPARLSLGGEMPIGPGVQRAVPADGAVRVNTGSRIPRGTGAVVMKEDCRIESRTVVIVRRVSPGDNVRLAGEEQRAGDLLLPAGVRVTPSVVGLAAAAGAARLVVWRRPAVAIIATGDELAPPGATLSRGMIHDANSPALAAAVAALGITAVSMFNARDRRADIRRSIRAALRAADVIITSGGASVGERDYAQEIAAGLGMRIGFSGVAIKPGKPVFFGTFGRGAAGGCRRLIFGMPGNPVAALVCFHQLVKPALLAMTGRPPPAPPRRAILEKPLRKKAGRLEWVRGVVRETARGPVVRPCDHQGSHMLSGLAVANCLITLSAETIDPPAGATVQVEPLAWDA